jgi:hypothetical protein
MALKRVLPFLLLVIFIFSEKETSGQSVSRLGPNYWVAGISSLEFYPVASIGRQRCPEWCWAASSQMILNYHGLYVAQEQIVNKIFGSLQCQGGTPDEIIEGLTGWAPDVRGRFSEIHSLGGLISPNDIVRNLAGKWPLLVCMDNGQGGGHAVVMTAVYYFMDQGGNAVIDKVVLRDPWPYNPSRQEMSWNEFSNKVTDIIRVWVVRL